MSGGASASFVYDGNGQRVKATFGGSTTVYVGNYYEQTGAASTKYYYAGSQRIALRRSDYVSDNGLFWLLTDHLGSTAITAYSSGGKKSELRYYAYGDTRYTYGTTPTAYKFTGQRLDESTGLMYYGARYYDPALGRFVQADTIVPEPGNPQALNRYSYVYNNPLKYTDPDGRIAFAIPLISGGVAAVVAGAVDLAKQLVVDQKDIGEVNWAEVGGAAAGGFVAGATMGLAPAGTSLLGLTLLGGAGSAAGGQVQALTQATLEQYMGNNPQGSILQEAEKLGFLDLRSAAIDAASGMATGLVGSGLARLFRSTGLLSEAADTITLRGEVPMIRWEKVLDQPGRWTFRMEGRVIVIDANTLERVMRGMIQGGYEFAESVLLEAIEQGLVEVVEENS